MTALTRCKPGDLAIVVSAYLPVNLGNIVEVLGPPNGVPFPSPWSCATWQVRTVSGRKTLFYKHGSGQCSKVERHAEGPLQDFKLRPLPGAADMDEIDRTAEIHVEKRIAVEGS